MKWLIVTIIVSLISTTFGSSTGTATYYGGNANGNACGFDGISKNSFPYGYYAAVGSSTFNDGKGCGACYKLTCTGPYGTNPSCHCSSDSVIIKALDQCPECDKTHFDLDPTAMAKIVGKGLSGTCGKIKIKYDRVSCDYKGNFKVRNKSGTSKYWYGLHLEDVAKDGAVKQVEIYKDGSKVGSCRKDNPTFWLCTPSSGSFPNTPLGIKIYGDQGSTAYDSNCITSFSGGKTMQCDTNFGHSNSGGGGHSSPTSKPTSHSGSSGSKLKITNTDSSNQWRYEVSLSNVPSKGISYIKMKAKGQKSWEKGIKSGTNKYYFKKYAPYSPPLAFKVRSNSRQTITSYNVITSLDSGHSGYLDKTFNDAFTEEDEKKTNADIWIAIILIIIALLVIIGITAYCMYSKKQQNKAQVSFQQNEQNNTTNTENDGGYDMSPIDVTKGQQTQTQTQTAENDHDEIEVQVEMETQAVTA